MGHISLEVPLRLLAFARSRQRHDAADPWVETLSNPFDDTAFASGITPLEYHHDLKFAIDHPVLQLDQLSLQSKQFSKIEPSVDGVLVLTIGEQLGESFVVELHFQLFVNAVENVAMEAIVKRILWIFAVRAHLEFFLFVFAVHVVHQNAHLAGWYREPV